MLHGMWDLPRPGLEPVSPALAGGLPTTEPPGKSPLSSFLFNIALGILARTFIQEREIKSIQIGKEEIKLSLFADDMILYIENPKDSTKKLLEIINEYNKVAWYKISIQKSVPFLYANNGLSEREIKKTITFTIARKRTIYIGIIFFNFYFILFCYTVGPCWLSIFIGINLTKDMKTLYTENYKTLLKEIEKDTKKWNHILCL